MVIFLGSQIKAVVKSKKNNKTSKWDYPRMAYKPDINNPQIFSLIIHYIPHCLIMTAVIFGGYISGLYLFMMPAICAYVLWLEYLHRQSVLPIMTANGGFNNTEVMHLIQYPDFIRGMMVMIVPSMVCFLVLTSDWGNHNFQITELKHLVINQNSWFIELYDYLNLPKGFQDAFYLSFLTRDIFDLLAPYLFITMGVYIFFSTLAYLLDFHGYRTVFSVLRKEPRSFLARLKRNHFLIFLPIAIIAIVAFIYFDRPRYFNTYDYRTYSWFLIGWMTVTYTLFNNFCSLIMLSTSVEENKNAR
jgi:hypothetical protein